MLKRTSFSSGPMSSVSFLKSVCEQDGACSPFIGYFRIVLALVSLYYMPLHPRTCTLLYSISCLLDALDGYAARYFEQSTKFGAVLDMVTDRCTTACLLVFLSSAWPRWALLFQGLISLDLASHYIHMYATLVMGGGDTSHKQVDKSRSWILNLYYTNKVCTPVFESLIFTLTKHDRLSSSSSVLSTKFSSSPSTSFPSPLLCSPHLSSKLPTMAKQQAHSSLEAPPIHLPHPSSLIPTAPAHWNSHAQIRWIQPGHGSLPESHSPSWQENKSSMSYNWSKLVDGWPREIFK